MPRIKLTNSLKITALCVSGILLSFGYLFHWHFSCWVLALEVLNMLSLILDACLKMFHILPRTLDFGYELLDTSTYKANYCCSLICMNLDTCMHWDGLEELEAVFSIQRKIIRMRRNQVTNHSPTSILTLRKMIMLLQKVFPDVMIALQNNRGWGT